MREDFHSGAMLSVLKPPELWAELKYNLECFDSERFSWNHLQVTKKKDQAVVNFEAKT